MHLSSARSSIASLCAATLLSAGCGTGQPPGPPGGQPATAGGPAGAPSCDARREAARRQVQEVIDAHRQCATDADCAPIGFATRCFDSCTRAVNASGVQATQEVIQRVNETTCATYQQDACPFVIPPCAPPLSPVCKQGACEM